MKTLLLTLSAALVVAGCLADDPGEQTVRERLDEPVELTLAPYLTMASAQVTVDGATRSVDFTPERGTLEAHVDQNGNLALSALTIGFAPIDVDGYALRDLAVRLAGEASCGATEWADDDQSCLGHTAASLHATGWRIGPDDSFQTSGEVAAMGMTVEVFHDGAHLYGDLMGTLAGRVWAWPGVRVDDLVLVVHAYEE